MSVTFAQKVIFHLKLLIENVPSFIMIFFFFSVDWEERVDVGDNEYFGAWSFHLLKLWTKMVKKYPTLK